MASTYAAGLRARQADQANGPWPKDGRKPPGWLLDRIAEEKLSGGYRTKPNRKGVVRNPICPGCQTARSANGECWC